MQNMMGLPANIQKIIPRNPATADALKQRLAEQEIARKAAAATVAAVKPVLLNSKALKTAMERPKSALQGGTPHMLALALPGECDPIRASDPGSTTKTALVSTHFRKMQYFDTGSTSTQGNFCVLKRDAPMNACHMRKKVANTATGNIKFGPYAEDSDPGLWYYLAMGIQMWLPLVSVSWSDEAETPQYAWTIDGKESSVRLLYLDAGAALTYSLERLSVAATGVLTCDVTGYFFDGTALIPVSSLTWRTSGNSVTTVSSTPYTLEFSGFYAFQVRIDCRSTALAPIDGEAQIAIGLTQPSTSFCSRFYPMYGLPGIANEVEGARMNAGALLMTNTTPESARGGNIAAVQLPVGQSWMHNLAPAGAMVAATAAYDVIAALKDAESLDGSTGMYGYGKPSNAVEYFEFVDTFRTRDGSNTIISSWAPILARNGEVVFAWSIPYSSLGSPSFVMTWYHTLEYTTDVQTREQRPSAISPQQFESELTTLRGKPQFMENPMHVKELRTIFGRGAMGFIKDARHLNKEARKLVNEVSPKLGSLLSALL